MVQEVRICQKMWCLLYVSIVSVTVLDQPSPGLHPLQVLDGLVDDFSSRLIQSHPSAQLHVTDAWRKMVLEKLCDVLSALCQTSSDLIRLHPLISYDIL